MLSRSLTSVCRLTKQCKPRSIALRSARTAAASFHSQGASSRRTARPQESKSRVRNVCAGATRIWGSQIVQRKSVRHASSAASSAASATGLNAALRIGDEVPDFKADTTQGPMNFHAFIEGSWAVLFSHPADFTPVCTTELSRVAHLEKEWTARGVKVAAISCDSVQDHEKWLEDVEVFGKKKVWYPVIADEDRSIAAQLGMLDQTTEHYKTGLPVTVRSVFIIGPDKLIKAMIVYPASTGRNFDEILRCVDSLQMTAKHKLATPADWKRGDDAVVIPAVSDEDAAKLFPAGFKKVFPYLRITEDPTVR